MKYVFLALLSLSIAQDISVDVYSAQSENANTEIFIETPDADVRVSVDAYSYPEYGYEGATAYVNAEGGDTTTDDLTVGYSTYVDTGYSSASAYAYDADGNYVSASQSTSVSADGQGSVNASEYVDVSTYDASTGNYTYDYASVDTQTYATQNESVTYSQTTVSVDNVEYYEETGVYVDNVNGEGYGYSEFYFWVNAQAFVDNVFGGFVMAFIVLSAMAVVGVMIYRKVKQETVKRYNATVRPVEECSNYIRI